MKLVSYDIEVLPDAFTMWAKPHWAKDWFYFEISFRKSNHAKLIQFFQWMLSKNVTAMVGYNCLNYDYPILHYIITRNSITPDEIYRESKRILDTPWNKGHTNRIWEPIVPQFDLFLIKHYNNAQKRTRLKYLEFAMRMDSVKESTLPFDVPVGTVENLHELSSYNFHDVLATEQFMLEHCMDDFKLRQDMTEKYGINMSNYNDSKLGSVIIEHELNKRGIVTKNRQTPRSEIVLGECLLPMLTFQSQGFTRIHEFFKGATIKKTKGAFDDIELMAYINGVNYEFGTGGLHGCVEPCTVVSDDDNVIIDVDVKSYYPLLAVANNWFPEHLGPEFADVIKMLSELRDTYDKGTSLNLAIKLAMNGTYGNSNSKFSIFYDPKFTMMITLNGQMLLCMLAEELMKIPNGQIIQANTDGITVKIPRTYVDHLNALCRWWEGLTGLILESVEYKTMYVRDVNNYIAEGIDGKFKLKGAYEIFKLPHKNHSHRIVAKMAFEALKTNVSPRQAIHQIDYSDPFDWLCCHKTDRSSQSFLGVDKVQHVFRYYISTDGQVMNKMMPPLPDKVKQGNTDWRQFAVEKGFLASDANDIKSFRWDNLNWEYYFLEAEKLTNDIQSRVV